MPLRIRSRPGRRLTMRDRVLSLLGLAAKAGKIESGNFAAEKAVKGFRAYLVILAEDAQKNTEKSFGNMCSFYEVPLRHHGTKESLGNAIGKEYRSCVAVTDKGFAESMIKLLGSEEERGCNGENENQ